MDYGGVLTPNSLGMELAAFVQDPTMLDPKVMPFSTFNFPYELSLISQDANGASDNNGLLPR